MGKETGFKEFERKTFGYKPVAERVKNYKEFLVPPTAKELEEQGARCMNCGVPFCHNGCPLGNIIPDFNDHVYRGKWDSALESLRSTNNFPEFTGRICPAPCESARRQQREHDEEEADKKLQEEGGQEGKDGQTGNEEDGEGKKDHPASEAAVPVDADLFLDDDQLPENDNEEVDNEDEEDGTKKNDKESEDGAQQDSGEKKIRDGDDGARGSTE